MMMGGALGNLVDRLLHGYVADSAITLGAACLILDEILRVRRAR